MILSIFYDDDIYKMFSMDDSDFKQIKEEITSNLKNIKLKQNKIYCKNEVVAKIISSYLLSLKEY